MSDSHDYPDHYMDDGFPKMTERKEERECAECGDTFKIRHDVEQDHCSVSCHEDARDWPPDR